MEAFRLCVGSSGFGAWQRNPGGGIRKQQSHWEIVSTVCWGGEFLSRRKHSRRDLEIVLTDSEQDLAAVLSLDKEHNP